MYMCRVRSVEANDITGRHSNVKYKGKSIYDVLDMTVEEALEFFKKCAKDPEQKSSRSMMSDYPT